MYLPPEAAPEPATVDATCVPWPLPSVTSPLPLKSLVAPIRPAKSGWLASMPVSNTATVTPLPVRLRFHAAGAPICGMLSSRLARTLPFNHTRWMPSASRRVPGRAGAAPVLPVAPPVVVRVFAQNWAVVVTNPNPDGAAYDVAVTVRFLDEAGDELRTVQANILDIEPGQTGAAADVADAPGAVRMEVTARAGSWDPTDSGWTLTGTVDGRTAEEPLVPGALASTVVVGSVTNTSDADLGAVPVVVFLDQSGRVVGGLANAFIRGVVAPAGTLVV